MFIFIILFIFIDLIQGKENELNKEIQWCEEKGRGIACMNDEELQNYGKPCNQYSFKVVDDVLVFNKDVKSLPEIYCTHIPEVKTKIQGEKQEIQNMEYKGSVRSNLTLKRATPVCVNYFSNCILCDTFFFWNMYTMRIWIFPLRVTNFWCL